MKNDVILITGGSSGYGKATAELFAKNGAKVIITGRKAETLQPVADAIGADAFVADATNPADWEKLYAYIMEKYGKLDMLVNNAGGGVAIKEVADISPEEIDKTITLNLNSALYGCHTFAPLFIKQKGGTIVNVSSVCAKQAWPGWTTYAASKWGVLGLTKGLTTELGPHGVRVTCIVPGAGATNFDANANFTGRGAVPAFKAENFAQVVYDLYNLPKTVWIEETTVWGIDQVVVPL